MWRYLGSVIWDWRPMIQTDVCAERSPLRSNSDLRGAAGRSHPLIKHTNSANCNDEEPFWIQFPPGVAMKLEPRLGPTASPERHHFLCWYLHAARQTAGRWCWCTQGCWFESSFLWFSFPIVDSGFWGLICAGSVWTASWLADVNLVCCSRGVSYDRGGADHWVQ